MKKIIALLAAMALLFTFVGCPGTNNTQEPTPETPETPNTPETPVDPNTPEEPELPALPEGWETGTALDLVTYGAYVEYADDYETYDWTIADKAGLEKLSELVLAGQEFSGHTVTLEADIDMNPGLAVLDENFDFVGDLTALSNFRPIGDNSTGKKFSGTFDGQNHVIRGLVINIDAEKIKGVGLFGKTGEATIKDLAIIDSYINVGEGQKNNDISRIGTLVGLVGEETTITNCYISSFVNGPWLGPDGINTNGVQGTQTADSGYGSEYMGGIVGRADSTIHIADCIFNGKVYNAHAAAGGIIGKCGKTAEEADIKNNLVMGKSITCPGGIGVISSSLDVPGNFILDSVEVTDGAKNGSFWITAEMLGNHIEEVTVGSYKIYKMKEYLEEGSLTKPGSATEEPAEPETPGDNTGTGDAGEGTGDAGAGAGDAGAGDAGAGAGEGTGDATPNA